MTNVLLFLLFVTSGVAPLESSNFSTFQRFYVAASNHFEEVCFRNLTGWIPDCRYKYGIAAKVATNLGAETNSRSFTLGMQSERED